MKIENVLKKFGDEKLEIKQFTVNADKPKKTNKSSSKNILVDFKDKMTKYMFMPFQVFSEVFMPKNSMNESLGNESIGNESIGHESIGNNLDGDEIIKKCSGKKNKRKCIKKAIKKTCRRKGNMRKMCKRTLKKQLLK